MATPLGVKRRDLVVAGADGEDAALGGRVDRYELACQTAPDELGADAETDDGASASGDRIEDDVAGAGINTEDGEAAIVLRPLDDDIEGPDPLPVYLDAQHGEPLTGALA